MYCLIFIQKNNLCIFVQVSSANSSKLDYDDVSDDEPRLTNNTRKTLLPVEFGGSFGNIVLVLLLPILVIVAKIALKAVMKTIYFSCLQ